MIGRREFISLLGGTGLLCAAKARRARAQPAMPVIGFLHTQFPDGFVEPLRGFRQGLKDAGFFEGENVAIEYRWAEINLTDCQRWRPRSLIGRLLQLPRLDRRQLSLPKRRPR